MTFLEWLKDLFSPVKPEEQKTVTSKPIEIPKKEETKVEVSKPVDLVKVPEVKPTVIKPSTNAEVSKPVPKPPEAPAILSKPVEPAAIVKPKAIDPITSKPTKIAILVGHTPKDPGAVNYKKEGEFVFNSRIAKKIELHMKKKYPNKQVKIFLRNDGDFSKTVAEVAKSVGAFQAKISLELHFNAVKQIAYGCEMLIWEGADQFEKTLKIADDITDRLAADFGLKERQSYRYKNGKYSDGVKVIARGDRGSWNIRACNQQGVVHAMLIEPCFANNETSESRAIFENEDKYAEFLADELAKIDV